MKQLPLNLATEPVESVRHARKITTRVLAGLLVLTVLHAAALLWMQQDAAARAAADAVPAIDAATLTLWQQEVADLEQVADVMRARGAAGAVATGNQLIAWRTIPWAAIFADLEGVLPDRVRLEAVQPAIDSLGQVQVSMQAVALDTGPLQDLLIRLEGHEHFARVYPQREEASPDGMARITLVATYEQAEVTQ